FAGPSRSLAIEPRMPCNPAISQRLSRAGTASLARASKNRCADKAIAVPDGRARLSLYLAFPCPFAAVRRASSTADPGIPAAAQPPDHVGLPPASDRAVERRLRITASVETPAPEQRRDRAVAIGQAHGHVPRAVQHAHDRDPRKLGFATVVVIEMLPEIALLD